MGNILAKKIGMTQVYNDQGDLIPVTVVEAGPCFVTQVKEKAVQLGFGRSRKLNKAQKGHLKGKECRHLREFKLEKTAGQEVGQEITVAVFNVGDLLTVSGVSIGKGFAGNVKRHHHGRGPMTHGSKSHRITGSIGAGTTPGRVFKGLNMPGRMGRDQVTVKDVSVVQIDAEKNLLLLKGALPGKKGNLLKISRTAAAAKAPQKEEAKKEEVKQ